LTIGSPLTINIGSSSLTDLVNNISATSNWETGVGGGSSWNTNSDLLKKNLNPTNLSSDVFQSAINAKYMKSDTTTTFTYSGLHIYQFNFNQVLNDFTLPNINNPYNEMLNIGYINGQITNWTGSTGDSGGFTDTLALISNDQATKSILSVQPGDTFCLVFDNYYPNWLPWATPSVFTTIQTGLPGCGSTTSKLVTDCGQNNVIDIATCGGCGTLTFVPNNNIPPNFEVPVLQVYNGVTLGISPNYNGGYLVATLLEKRVNITIPGAVFGTRTINDFIYYTARMMIGKNSYVTRIDYAPNSNSSIYVIYWTTFTDPAVGTYQVYSYDSAGAFAGPNIKYPNIVTNNDKNNKLSDQYIKVTGDNKYGASVTLSLVSSDNIVLSTIQVTPGSSYDFNYLKILPQCGSGWRVLLSYGVGTQSITGCGEENIDITAYMSNLGEINVQVTDGTFIWDANITITLFDKSGYRLNYWYCEG